MPPTMSGSSAATAPRKTQSMSKKRMGKARLSARPRSAWTLAWTSAKVVPTPPRVTAWSFLNLS